MSSQPLPDPVRLVSANEVQPASGFNEPVVKNVKAPVSMVDMFGGSIRRGVMGNDNFPASNDGELSQELPAGSGVVRPGGTNVYFLDLAPGFTTPMHRTTSTDFLVVNKGTPTLVTPKGSFNVVDSKGTYEETVETVCSEGEVIVQRGQFHAWKNATDSWVRLLAFIVDAKPQELELGSNEGTKQLTETWLEGWGLDERAH